MTPPVAASAFLAVCDHCRRQMAAGTQHRASRLEMAYQELDWLAIQAPTTSRWVTLAPSSDAPIAPCACLECTWLVY